MLVSAPTFLAADQWWYAEHFPAIYSSESEWCVVQNDRDNLWFYSYGDSQWYSSEEYAYDSSWWYMELYPYLYSTEKGWIYCYSPTNSLIFYEIANESSGTIGNSSGQSVAPIDWAIQNGTVGNAIDIDLSEAFSISGNTPTFSVALSNDIPGIVQSGNNLQGSPEASGVVDLVVTASLENGSQVSQFTQLVIDSSIEDLPTPNLPSQIVDYEAIISNFPAQYTSRVDDFGDIRTTDNTPNNNPITNAGATLGRVLFYDKRLSQNNSTSCASCHKQEAGFSDERRFSLGFEGGETGRHWTALSHARYYERGRFFWDERADTLEDQVLMPIQDSVEMGMSLDALREKLADTDFYGALFTDAFGDDAITDERISFALAQFVRAMVSTQSKFDQAFVNGNLDTSAFTDQELEGLQLFSGNAEREAGA